MPTLARVALALATCASIAAARQAPILPRTGPPLADERAVLVRSDGADVFATAPGWAAFFDAQGVRFLPAEAGAAVPVELGLALQSVHRAGAPPTPAAPTRPRAEGGRVVYARGWAEEVWEARLDGLKQSFVLAEPPPGRGELVVRLRLDTDLAPTCIAPEGLVLERGGVGVRIGAVVGIDAAGREASGELRLVGDRLDLVLPGGFVDDATYPLELDPLVQPFRTVPGTGAADADPDVAWDASTRRHCIVWKRFYSGATAHFAQLFEEDGTPVWPAAFLGWVFGPTVHPAVCAAGSGEADSWFVTAHGLRTGGPSHVLVWAVRASDLKMRRVRYRVPVLVDVDLGGSGDASGAACLVWSESWGIRAQRFRVPGPASDDLLPQGEPRYLAGGPTSDDGSWSVPRISQSNGVSGSWLVVWERIDGGFFPEARAILPGGGLGSTLPLSLSGFARNPSCDGDGERFLAAFEEDFEIYGRLLSLSGPALVVEQEAVLSDSSTERPIQPQVAITPLEGADAFTVAWRRWPGGSPIQGTVRYRAYETPDLAPYGPEQVLASEAYHLRVASLHGASPAVPVGYSRLFALVVEQADALRAAIAVP